MLRMDEKPYPSTEGVSPAQPMYSNSCGLFTLMNLGMVLELYGQGKPPHHHGKQHLSEQLMQHAFMPAHALPLHHQQRCISVVMLALSTAAFPFHMLNVF